MPIQQLAAARHQVLPLGLPTSVLRGPRSSQDSEMFTHLASLLLRREVRDAIAKPTELLG